jgi:hypothetical protein
VWKFVIAPKLPQHIQAAHILTLQSVNRTLDGLSRKF